MLGELQMCICFSLFVFSVFVVSVVSSDGILQLHDSVGTTGGDHKTT